MKLKKWHMVLALISLILGGILYRLYSLGQYVKAHYEITNPKEIAERLKSNPNDVAALTGKAHGLVGDGKDQEAIPVFRKVIALRPYDDDSKILLALLLVKAKQKPEAIRLFREVSESNTEYASEAKRRLTQLGEK